MPPKKIIQQGLRNDQFELSVYEGSHFRDGKHLVEYCRNKASSTYPVFERCIITPILLSEDPEVEDMRNFITVLDIQNSIETLFHENPTLDTSTINWKNKKLLLGTSSQINIAKEGASTAQRKYVAIDFSEDRVFELPVELKVIIVDKNKKSVSSNLRGGSVNDFSNVFVIAKKQVVSILTRLFLTGLPLPSCCNGIFIYDYKVGIPGLVARATENFMQDNRNDEVIAEPNWATTRDRLVQQQN
jgi:hypothetical protein